MAGSHGTLTDLDLAANALRELPREMRVLTHLRALSLYNNRLRAVPTEMEHLIKSLGRFRVSKNPMDGLPQRWSSRWDLANQYHRPSGWTEEGVTDWSLFSNTWYPHAVREWEKWAGARGKDYRRAEAARADGSLSGEVFAANVRASIVAERGEGAFKWSVLQNAIFVFYYSCVKHGGVIPSYAHLTKNEARVQCCLSWDYPHDQDV